MILIFGGTTEGKNIAKLFDQKQIPYIYSTKTFTRFEPGASGHYRWGMLDDESMAALIKAQNITAIVNAAHPFADQLHKIIAEVSQTTGIPAIRFDRTYSEPQSSSHIEYFKTYNEIISRLKQGNAQRLLALTGVQSVNPLKPFWQEHTTFLRILPREASRNEALLAGFPEENLLMEWPAKDAQQEKNTIIQLQADAMLCKESGDSGFLHIKQEAAAKTGIPLLLLQKPVLPSGYILVDNEQQLMEQLNLNS